MPEIRQSIGSYLDLHEGQPDRNPGARPPLEYWRRLEEDPVTESLWEGRAVSYDTVGRYLDNETFAYRFLGGWIGTTGTQTKVLDPIVREIVATGRTVTIAVKRHLTQEERQAAHLASAAEFDEDALRSV
ncbi:MAG TPA: hypothetical protein VHL32_02950 [Gemmatimonadaceae bacterium]|jgi:hypothetical protein|nr:hypothetical protein [Gemmatimonadaceae bacterium]